MNLIINLVATIAGGIILGRSICVINNMDRKRRGVVYLQFLAFGTSYGLLACAALFAVAQIWDGVDGAVNWLFLLSSAGLIVFDRRTRRAGLDDGIFHNPFLHCRRNR